MTLTDYFNSLQQIDKCYNKYATYSLTFNNPYRLATSYDAFKYDKFDIQLKNWIAEQGKCIVMPNMYNNSVMSLLFRSLQTKKFRYYTEHPYIPYGAGVNNKPYTKPWIIVESALDSDFIRNFYPFVLSTNGVSLSNNLVTFIKGTCSQCYCGFDTDKAGNEAFHNLCFKHSGGNKGFHIKRFLPPKKFDGSYLKDFGEILDCLYKKQMDEYDYYCTQLKTSFLYLN